jgi:hypothetical protein
MNNWSWENPRIPTLFLLIFKTFFPLVGRSKGKRCEKRKKVWGKNGAKKAGGTNRRGRTPILTTTGKEGGRKRKAAGKGRRQEKEGGRKKGQEKRSLGSEIGRKMREIVNDENGEWWLRCSAAAAAAEWTDPSHRPAELLAAGGRDGDGDGRDGGEEENCWGPDTGHKELGIGGRPGEQIID